MSNSRSTLLSDCPEEQRDHDQQQATECAYQTKPSRGGAVGEDGDSDADDSDDDASDCYHSLRSERWVVVRWKDTLDSGHRLAVLMAHDAGVTIAEDSAALAHALFGKTGGGFALQWGYFCRHLVPITFGRW